MAQKAQFISAVAHNPDLMFFDEPFSGLDPVSVDVLRDAILDLSNKGKTILFSTHVMEQAEKLCTRIFLINKGKKVISGRLDEVKNRFGENSVIVEFSGNGDFIDSLPMVEAINRYPRWVEVLLKDGSSADSLLAELVGKVSIRKFELQTPSLHRIFVSAVSSPESSEKEGSTL